MRSRALPPSRSSSRRWHRATARSTIRLARRPSNSTGQPGQPGQPQQPEAAPGEKTFLQPPTVGRRSLRRDRSSCAGSRPSSTSRRCRRCSASARRACRRSRRSRPRRASRRSARRRRASRARASGSSRTPRASSRTPRSRRTDRGRSSCRARPSGTGDTACFGSFVTPFGQRAFRRPLDDRRGHALHGADAQTSPPRPAMPWQGLEATRARSCSRRTSST